jgi:hypothetical protein
MDAHSTCFGLSSPAVRLPRLSVIAQFTATDPVTSCDRARNESVRVQRQLTGNQLLGRSVLLIAMTVIFSGTAA